ncbi:MAG: hypothetical protein IJT72_02835 [Lachnospiraceae bacterium]|nr:hypothetical protein [Lachnospiraceae bacterium]
MEESLNKSIIDNVEVKPGLPEIKEEVNAYQYSPLSLAYLGDSVLDLMVKSYFVVNVNKQTYKYHKDVTHIVNAVNQSAFVDLIMDELSEDELDIYKRGRNANAHSKAKNATRSEYRKATGLEALLGYLYLRKEQDRLEYLVNKMIKLYLENN